MKFKITLLTLSLIATTQLNAMELCPANQYPAEATDSPNQRAQRRFNRFKEILEPEYKKDVAEAKNILIIENLLKGCAKGCLTTAAGLAIGYVGYRKLLTDTSLTVKFCWGVGTGCASVILGKWAAQKHNKNLLLLSQIDKELLLSTHRDQCNAAMATKFYDILRYKPEPEWIKVDEVMSQQFRKDNAYKVIADRLKKQGQRSIR